MATKLGNNDTTFKVGSTDVDAIYLGSTLVYSGGTLPSGDNVVTYTALEQLSIYNEFRDENGNALAVISHTFSNGNGTIVLDGDVYGISHEAFEYNDYITSIVLPNTVTEIGDAAFDNCTGLTSINIPSGVTFIDEYTFRNCGITAITLPDGLTSIGDSAFMGCSSLSGTLTIPSGVTTIESSTFNGCSSLQTVILPNGLTSIGESAFRECGLFGIYIPSGVTLIDREAFNECGRMQIIQFGSTTPPTLGSMAFDNTGDCPIFVPSGYANTYKNAGGNWSDYEDRIQEL